MALERVREILKFADKKNTAVMSFICIDYNMLYSVVKTSEKLNMPVLCMLLPEHAEKNNIINFRGFYEMAKELIKETKNPIGIHLDHSYDFIGAVKGIRSGFDSIMIDYSSKKLEDNISYTKKVVEVAHMFDVSVEAELGHVGEINEYNDYSANYTAPESVKAFCENTNTDFLTISIGNAHGMYLKKPELDIERLKKINKITDIPLVLHGGSGIPEIELKEAFKNGINKLNIGTEFLNEYYRILKEFINEDTNENLKILEIANYVQKKLEIYIEKKLSLCDF